VAGKTPRKAGDDSDALSVWENEGGGLGPSSHPNYAIYLTVETAFREAAVLENPNQDN
jgi:hypothetical protein